MKEAEPGLHRDPTKDRLSLAEALVAENSPADLARTTLGWLSRAAGLEHGLCAVVERCRHRLCGLCGHGLDDEEVSAYEIDLDEDDPLAMVLDGESPVFVDEATLQTLPASEVPRGMGPFWAVPLGTGGTPMVGLLLAAGDAIDAAELRWASDLLGIKLAAEATHELRRESDRLERELQRLEASLEAVPDPVLVTDDQENILLMNPPAERLFDSDEHNDNAGGRRIRSNRAVLSSFLGKLQAQGTGRYTDRLGFLEPSGGEELTVQATAGQVTSERGDEAAVVTILHDLGEAMEKALLYDKFKRHSEELEARCQEATAELAEQNEMLRRKTLEAEEASAMKSQFLANVSHELRTPLNVILYYSTLLRDGVYGDLEEAPRDKLEKVTSNAQHLAELISEILDFSRIEAGKLQIVPEDVDLRELVEEVVAELEVLVDNSDVDVGVQVSPALPTLHTDRGKVKQVLVNLLSNALKFTPEGSVRMEATMPDPGRVAIAVEDTGVGIPQEQQRTVFEPFGRSGSAAGASDTGSGLGLSICKRLAESLGGSLELDSTVGEGSTFTLRIPARVADDR